MSILFSVAKNKSWRSPSTITSKMQNKYFDWLIRQFWDMVVSWICHVTSITIWQKRRHRHLNTGTGRKCDAELHKIFRKLKSNLMVIIPFVVQELNLHTYGTEIICTLLYNNREGRVNHRPCEVKQAILVNQDWSHKPPATCRISNLYFLCWQASDTCRWTNYTSWLPIPFRMLMKSSNYDIKHILAC